MAEEVDADKGVEAPIDAVEPAAERAPGSGPAAAAEAKSSWSWTMQVLAFVAVLLTVDGVFELTRHVLQPIGLGLGLLLWGALDLTAQGRGLVAWKGPRAALGNGVNALRGLALLGVGVWLCLMAAGIVRTANPAVIIWVGVCVVTLYLAAALVLELLVQGLRVGSQAFLLAGLVLMAFSYYYFAMPFVFAWAAVFAFLSFACAAWSLKSGALSQNPFLSLAVLAVLLVLGTPLLVYSYQQSFVVEEQPLFTPTLLVPRMREVIAGLSGEAAQILWSPVHTQPGQPGDVLFSDKLAFVDRDHGQACVKLFQQHEDGLHEIVRVRSGEGISLTAFSNDGSRLAYTDASSTAKGASLYVLEPMSASEAEAASASAKLVRAQARRERVPFSFKHFYAWLKSALGLQAAPGSVDALALTPTAESGTVVVQVPFSFRHFFAWLQSRLNRPVRPEPQEAGSLAYHSRLLVGGVAPGPGHGQVWRALGRELYFAEPDVSPRNPASSVRRFDFADGGGVDTLLTGRALPAVSPDGRGLLSVGFIPRHRYLEIADEERVDGQATKRDPRVFVPGDEASYFPAWNEAQTQVLFLDSSGRMMTMDANGKNHRVFDPNSLDSKYWRSGKQVPFTLQWIDVDDEFAIHRSDPDGSGDRIIYTTDGQAISAPQWSADEKRVAFVITKEGASEVVTVGSDGSWPRHFFTTKDSLDELKWSPDSLRVAWICRRHDNGNQEIWTAGYEGLDPVLVHTDDGSISGLTWSPRGKHLAVQQTKAWTLFGLRFIKPDLQTVLMVDLVDHHARVMTRYGIFSRDPSFSPHGEAIAYFTDQHLWNLKPVGDRRSALVISQLY
jgi:Tol biopolymer transport system component